MFWAFEIRAVKVYACAFFSEERKENLKNTYREIFIVEKKSDDDPHGINCRHDVPVGLPSGNTEQIDEIYIAVGTIFHRTLERDSGHEITDRYYSGQIFCTKFYLIKVTCY